MLISLMSSLEIKEQVFPKKLISLMWTILNECGIKECGTKECGIDFWETSFNSQT